MGILDKLLWRSFGVPTGILGRLGGKIMAGPRKRFDEVQHLRDEVYRLRNLITSVARWLRDHGHPLKASLVMKELEEPADEDQR